MTNYRVVKMTEVPATDESSALSLSIKLHRALEENPSMMNQETMGLVKQMEKLVPVLGPPSIFIRLKVDHPKVAQIVKENLSRYLQCVLVDKKDLEAKEAVRMLVFKSLHRNQFAYVDFGHHRHEVEKVDTSDSLVLEGEDRLEEALRLSMEAGGGEQGEKRKRSEDLEDTSSKRIKLDTEEGGETNDDLDEENEDDDDLPDIPKSIYAPTETASPEFPTILELLCIDQPLVQALLVDKCQVDSSLVVPQFEEFLHHPSLLASDKVVVGCDSDGSVASVRPDKFCQDGGAVLGYIETPNSILSKGPNPLKFWGGKDIRHKWPEFAKQLDRMDKKAADADEEKPKGCKLNLPIVIPTSSRGAFPKEVVKKDDAAGSSSISSSTDDLMAFLAARGVSVQKK